MPEFELDQESVSRAKNLSSKLSRDLRMVLEGGPPSEMREPYFSEQRYAEYAEGVPIKDVVTNVGQMAKEFYIIRRVGAEIPCLKLDDGDLAPISMSRFFGFKELFDYGFYDSPIDYYSRSFLKAFLRPGRRMKEGVVLTDVSEVLGSVERNLSGFLSYRFDGMKRWGEWIQGIGGQLFRGSKGPPQTKSPGGGIPPPPAVGSGGGLQVQVSCLTPGLRIHIAPAYFITYVVFGGPPIPVTGYVHPGRYVFAGDGPMFPELTPDLGVFCIPPTFHPSLVSF